MLNSHEKETLKRAHDALESDISKDDLQALLTEINLVLATSKSSSWWVVALKVVAYAIGLILGGALTTSCCSHLIF